MNEKIVGYIWGTKQECQLTYDFQDDLDIIFDWITKTLENFSCPVNFRNILAVWTKIAMPAILKRMDELSDRDIYEVT